VSDLSPIFLTREIVEDLHHASLARFGGTHGLRDDNLLESAIAAAENAYFYGRADLFEIAATYAFHLAEAQAFLDGNKRTAIAAALTFLEANGHRYGTDDGTLYDAMIAIAEKRMNKAALATLFRKIFGECRQA
jgi:death-on-curing protein